MSSDIEIHLGFTFGEKETQNNNNVKNMSLALREFFYMYYISE